METKTARLTILLDPAKKKAFEQLCAQQDVTPSQVVRRLMVWHAGGTANVRNPECSESRQLTTLHEGDTFTSNTAT